MPLFSGQTVRVTSNQLGDDRSVTEFYVVAEPRPIKAQAIIRAGIGAPPEVRVEAVAPRSPAEMMAFHLKPGEDRRK